MTLQKILIAFGVIFLAIGVLGFIPAVAPNGMLLGLFHVNLVHNIIHLATGAIALIVAFSKCGCFTPRCFFKAFGIVYGLVAILGFWYGNAAIFGIIANNLADAFLHLAIAVISLYLGFAYEE